MISTTRTLILAAAMGTVATIAIGVLLHAAGLRHTGAHIVCEWLAVSVVATVGLHMAAWLHRVGATAPASRPTSHAPRATWDPGHQRRLVGDGTDNVLPAPLSRRAVWKR